MSLSAKLRRAPLRAVTGAYILNSGVGKLGADDDTAKNLHGMASGTYGFLGNMQPGTFTKVLGAGEIAVGSALLLPIVPPAVAGLALVGFSGALLNLYWRTPGMHEEGNPRPTAQGLPIAKDSWLFGIGTGLIADALLQPAHDKRVEVTATVSEKRSAQGRRAKRKAAKAAAKAAKHGASVRSAVDDAQTEVTKRAERAGSAARDTADRATSAARDTADRAREATEKVRSHAERHTDRAAAIAGKRLAELRAEYAPMAVERAKQAKDAAQRLVS